MNSKMKKWKSIESQHRFFCDGRCVMGHEIGIFIFALILISGTSGLFFAFDCPYLTTRLSPLVPIFGVILYLNVIGFILRTACSDPGILPRGHSDEISYLEKSSVPSGTTGHISLPGRTMELRMATGQILQLKYCSTCKIFRPPRVSHCSLCDACIANFDHHCPWVGNCVGLRNYRYFYLFLFSLSLLCIYIFTFNIVNIALRSQEKPSFADAIRETPATVIQGLICFFSIWSILGLWGYHTYLICRSVTTNEDIKETWNSSSHHGRMKNPFSKGNPCLNCFSTLCGPLPPSFLNLRTVIPIEDNSHRRTSPTYTADDDEYRPSYSDYDPQYSSTNNYV